MNKRIYIKVIILGIIYGLIPVSMAITIEALITYIPELIMEGNIELYSFQYIIWAIVFVPFWEELFFRKFLYGKLSSIISLNFSMLISSLIFAIMHGNVMIAIFSFVLGCVNCKLYSKFETIIIPIAFHASANFVSIVDRNIFKQIYVNYGQLTYGNTKIILIISSIFIILLPVLFFSLYRKIRRIEI